MISISEVVSRAVIACFTVWALVGVVVVVWNGWDRWQNRRWEKERNHP